jgi:alcohol dehydrogenase, propanol-preferring
MKVMRLSQPGAIKTSPLLEQELPVPDPGFGEALLRVKACGVCHTDLHTVEGEIHPPSLPVTPGHQVIGVIEKLGQGSNEYVKIGDRVGVPWLYSACGNCEFCGRGQENLCPQARFTGFHVDGGYAGWMLAEARWVLPIPAAFSDVQAAPLLCAGIIGYRSLHLADLQKGERLGLVGFGASAHLAIQVAIYWGCEVYVFTRSEEHRRHAHELGAAWVGGAEDDPPGKLDRAVIFAPAGYLVPVILTKLRPGGTLAINAIYMSDIPSMAYALIYGERTLRSVANATYRDGIEFLALADEINIQPTVSTYSLDEANKALLDLKESRIKGEGVLVV